MIALTGPYFHSCIHCLTLFCLPLVTSLYDLETIQCILLIFLRKNRLITGVMLCSSSFLNMQSFIVDPHRYTGRNHLNWMKFFLPLACGSQPRIN